MSHPSFYTLVSDGARIALRVTPNASADRVEGVQSRADGSCALKVRVCAPPDKGAANSAVIALLAKTLCLPKSALTLSSGSTSRTKVILARGDAEALQAALEGLADR